MASKVVKDKCRATEFRRKFIADNLNGDSYVSNDPAQEYTAARQNGAQPRNQVQKFLPLNAAARQAQPMKLANAEATNSSHMHGWNDRAQKKASEASSNKGVSQRLRCRYDSSSSSAI